MHAMNPALSPKPPLKAVRSKWKGDLNKAKTVDDIAKLLDMTDDELDKARSVKLDELLPMWSKRKEVIERGEEGSVVEIVQGGHAEGGEERPLEAVVVA